MNEFDPDEIEGLIAAHLSGHPLLTHPEEAAGATPVDWRHLVPEAAGAAWAELREWVEWITVRYNMPISVIPACWWKHGALVEELSALHVAHLASFDGADTGLGPLGWHERFAQAQARLQRAGSGCTSQHHESKPRSWVATTDEAEWDAWIDQSHAR